MAKIKIKVQFMSYNEVLYGSRLPCHSLKQASFKSVEDTLCSTYSMHFNDYCQGYILTLNFGWAREEH